MANSPAGRLSIIRESARIIYEVINMYQIDNKRFGKFISEMRKERNMTQKELAGKLFVSDKTVSKWERGSSIPNVILLIPIADVFGVTVTELLKGRRIEHDIKVNTDEAESIVVDSLVRSSIQQHKKNWIFVYLITIFIVLIEVIILAVSEITFDQMDDSLYVAGLMLLFAGWLCIFTKDLLPGYYDENKINYVSQGVFRLHMVGLSFNNGNWTYVCTVLKIFTLGISVTFPLLCYGSILLGDVVLWNRIKDIFIVTILVVMMISVYIVGKKYE